MRFIPASCATTQGLPDDRQATTLFHGNWETYL
jgi:hypothetical protein